MTRPGTRGPWTHIVVGAGAAGCVAAARLSESANNRVLLIESGVRSRSPLIRVPMATGLLLRGSRHTQQFHTEPVPGLNNRRTLLPRGVVIGGSTAINGMVYIRGLASDYDAWASTGLRNWSYEQVLPYFQRSENFVGQNHNNDTHGVDGPLTISRRSAPVSELTRFFTAAGVDAGYPACDNFNTAAPDGFGYYHFTINKGRRVTAVDAFLKNASKRGRLDVVSGVIADQLILENGRATGIVVCRKGRSTTHYCEQELVLCAGVFGSPGILMRSGIGAANDLQKLGITPSVDAPAVGANLHDHVLVRVRHRADVEHTLHGLTRIDCAAMAFLRAYFTGQGPMSVFPLEAGAMLRSRAANQPDLQANFLPALSSASLRLNPFRKSLAENIPGFFASVSLMRPKSRGFFRLSSSDPLTMPLVQPNYLAEADDLERMIDGVEILRDVFSSGDLKRFSRGELDPGELVRSRTELGQFVRNTADTVHHAVGTCRMGADDQSVVDEYLRVRGVRGLRVADASVFPSIPSMNTMAASYMVGERVADFICSGF